ncbi:MAG: hypothetical protein M0Z95_20920 [Actinomycetota bacterium]|jgi:hypothetical protein|nr:hypothetical protein [Actinomycetota bacterium]
MTRNGWTTRDYLSYTLGRMGEYLRAGVAGQLVGVAAVVVGWVFMASHESTVKHYVGAAVPKLLVPKVRTGAHVTAEVSSNAVRFVETFPGTHAQFVLGTFPRGLGYAHLGTATTIGQSVLHWLVPWLPLALLAWALEAMVHTILSRRLLPSASDYCERGRTRTMGQILVRKADAPRRREVRTVDDTDAGRTLSEWARRYGGNHGQESLAGIVVENRTRRQPSFGAVLDARTRLRAGWELLVPLAFGKPMERELGTGRRASPQPAPTVVDRLGARGDTPLELVAPAELG